VKPSLADVAAFIADADRFKLARVGNLIEARRIELGSPDITQAQAQKLFPPTSAVEICNTSDASLNGARGTVEKIDRTKVKVNIAGVTIPVPFTCVAPITADELAAYVAAPKTRAQPGTPFVVIRGKLIDRRGVFVAQGRLRHSVIMDDGAAYDMPSNMMRLESIPPTNPQRLIRFFVSYGQGNPYGIPMLCDLSKVDETTARSLTPQSHTLPPGVLPIKMMQLSNAQLLAKGFGYRIELVKPSQE